MVYDEGRARAGEHALVFGASGGVGIFTVALLKRLGLTVHVVTSNIRKREALLAQGADTVLPDNPGAVLRHMRGLPDGGADIAFNCVGGTTWRYVPPAVRPGGRILVCGSVRSPAAELDMRHMFYRSVALLGCSMGSPAALLQMLEAAADDARMQVPIDSVIKLAAVPDSHRRMESGALNGKIVIHISS
jgi:NADPH2:quinone reductase